MSEGQEGETEIETVKSELLRYLNERKYILFYPTMHVGRYIYVSGYIHMVFEKSN